MQRRRGRMLAQGLGLVAAFGVLIALPQTAAEGVRSGLTLCGQVILPSLFPFFVCSNLFVLLGFSARVSARFGGLAARLLRLPPNAGSAFVIGMTGGYPAGVQAVGLLYERGELSRDEAEHALAVCNQAGPSFIFGFLGGAVFAHPGAGALLCGVQLAAAVLTCRLTAKPLTAAQRAHSAPQRQAQPDFAAAFSEAVRRAGMSAIHVCMFVTVFSVLSGYLRLAAGAHLPADAAPLALGAPSTFWHQLHTSDDASMRWQYGTFLRVVRLIGMLIHLFLPGAYIAVIRFHTELISPILLASVYETSSRVPTPIFLEALLMTLAFDLISEAGLRAPGAMGNALGIVSGLILGQSAVSADIVSPLLLIVVAASGLGGFCIPNYALSVGIKIIQLLFLTAGALGGLYLMALLGLALLCAACAMRSVGSPLTAPLTPKRPGNPDLLIRFPLWRQKARAFFARQDH